MTHTGYLIGLNQQRTSGLALAYFSERRDGGSVREVPVDGGTGVRLLLGAYIDAGHYPTIPTGPKAPKATYTVDTNGVLQSIRL